MSERPTLIRSQRPTTVPKYRRQTVKQDMQLLLAAIVVFWVGLFTLLPLFVHPNSSSCDAGIYELKIYAGAETLYRSHHQGRYATADQLAHDDLIDPRLADFEDVYGFCYRLAAAPNVYHIAGIPLNDRNHEQFYTDESGVIYAAVDTAPFPARDTHGQPPGPEWTVVGSSD